MSRSRTFFLVAVSFIVGFLLREMLHGIADERIKDKGLKYYNTTDEVKQIAEKKPFLEVIKLDIPHKVIRGSYFEMFGYFRKTNDVDENYTFEVMLISYDAKSRINSGRLIIPKEGLFFNGQETKHALRILVPVAAPLGKYKIFINRKPLGEIEIVSYSSIQQE